MIVNVGKLVSSQAQGTASFSKNGLARRLIVDALAKYPVRKVEIMAASKSMHTTSEWPFPGLFKGRPATRHRFTQTCLSSGAQVMQGRLPSGVAERLTSVPHSAAG